MTPPIFGFFGRYRWLSNFWPATITSKSGLVFQSAEAAYQAAKCLSAADMATFVPLSASEAKRRGRRVPIRPDWNQIRQSVMLAILRQKFGPANPDLRKLLQETLDAHLEEANTWGDTFWGTCHGEGQNILGKLLMQIRGEIS